MLATLASLAVLAAPRPAVDGEMIVLVDAGRANEFLPAARAMAELHGAEVRRFEPKTVRSAILALRKSPARQVVFVLPPEELDIDLAHTILEAASELDDDPFCDLEYGFITGRDGAAASRFVERIAAARKREFGKSVGTFTGSDKLAPRADDAAEVPTNAFGFSFRRRWASATDERTRVETARKGLSELRGCDLLLFYSHGSPMAMGSCFRGEELGSWGVDLSSAILFNCACYNGAPSRWFFSRTGKPTPQASVPRNQSVALALLDSGISGYFAGLDGWHGILSNQAFLNVVDDGLTLGGAAKRLCDRALLDALPARLEFEPMKDLKAPPDAARARRETAASGIFYGDPSFAPYASSAGHCAFGHVERAESGALRVTLGLHPARPDPATGTHGLIVRDRLISYLGDKEDGAKRNPMAMEVYRAIAVPFELSRAPDLRLASARAGGKDVPTGKPVIALEETPRCRILHVLVPLAATIDSPWYRTISTEGISITLEEAGK
jgi:hypothetical protein